MTDKKPSVLYVEDDNDIRDRLVLFFKYFTDDLYLAKDGKEGLELYIKHKPDIVVSDIKMPNMNGIEMVKEIKNINKKQHVIFTTAHNESGFFMDLINMQVDGYILKPIDLDKLKEKLDVIKENIELTNFYLKYQKILERKVYIDSLTNIYNRAYFEEGLDKEIARVNRENTYLSLIILDIDFFKNINDTYGHQVGDDILIEIASLIGDNTRKTDIFARWGGEEFVKILPNTNLEKALIVAESLRKKIEEHNFSNNIKITCSFGVSEFKSDDDKHKLVKRADKALYLAKENGRNKVENFVISRKEDII